MQKDDLNTIRFAAIICLACSLVLAGVRTMLKSTQERNLQIDKQVMVLKALYPSFDPDGNPLTAEEQEELFLEGKIKKEHKDWIPRYFESYVSTNSVALPKDQAGMLYKLVRDEKVEAIAFPAEGKGLWSTVHSYVGLEPDLATIRGVTFFDHAETPGLGGECSKPWFQKNFQQQVIYTNGAPVTLEVVKGKAEMGDRHAVDGMSGATITGNGIQKFVNNTFRAYNEAVFEDMRPL